MEDSQQTRQNMSQSVINELGSSDNTDEARKKNKRDVGIQYDFICLSDREKYVDRSKLLRRTYSLNNCENEIVLHGKKNNKSENCDVKLRKMSYDAPKSSLERKGSLIKKCPSEVGDFPSLERISPKNVKSTNAELPMTANSAMTNSVSEEIRETVVEGRSAVDDEKTTLKSNESSAFINVQQNCAKIQNGKKLL